MRYLPSISPLPRVVPNFVDPEDISYQVFVAAGVFFPLLTVFLGLRIFAKHRILSRGPGATVSVLRARAKKLEWYFRCLLRSLSMLL